MAPFPLAVSQGAAAQSLGSQIPSVSSLGSAASVSLSSPVTTPTLRQLHDLPAKSFNHLSVFAYLAIGFIILSVTTVLAYIMYSCYHTAKGRMDTTLAPNFTPSPVRGGSADDVSDETVFGDNDGGKVHSVLQPKGMSGGIGAMARVGSRVVEVGEKARRTSSKFGQAVVLEMRSIRSSTSPKIYTESLHNIAAHANNSQSTLSDVGTIGSLGSESDAYYLSSPPMAHTSSERSAAYVLPFHLPPPPPSPTPAHKQHIVRKYGGQQSPISPSPSFCTTSCSPPPITPKLRSPGAGETSAAWSGPTIFGSENSESNIGKEKAGRTPASQRKEVNASPDVEKEVPDGVQFDSNNIRFVSPNNPFSTSTGASIWSDPKLSPVNGSIVLGAVSTTPPTDTPLNDGSPLAKAMAASSVGTTPVSTKSKKNGSPNKSHFKHRRYNGKENGSGSPQGRGRKDTLRAVERPSIMSSLAKPNSGPP